MRSRRTRPCQGGVGFPAAGLTAAFVLLLAACLDREPRLTFSPDAGPGPALDGGATVDAGAPVPDAGPPDAGVPDAGPVTCTSCHGSDANPAPPRDTEGRTEETWPSVGAHQAHLRGSLRFRTPQCSDCHRVPSRVDEPGHLGPAPAELVWSDVARAGGVVAQYDGRQCTVYCHGASLAGREVDRPSWTPSGSRQVFCGSCHGVPMPAPHPQVFGGTCGPCHPFNGLTPLDPARHGDGVVDFAVGCNLCHGGPAGPYPPLDTHGNTSTLARGVGAHASHMGSSSWRAQIACSECHRVPERIDAPGHIDGDGVAEVTFGTVATQGNRLRPEWRVATDGSTSTCANTYCHGASLQPDRAGATSVREPTWTRVDGTQKACGAACHTLPPGGNHPASTGCPSCHATVISRFDPANPAAAEWADPSRHIDGRVDVAGQSCTSCHGDPTRNDPAPPLGTRGESSTTQRAVGAHAAHLGASAWHRDGRCEDCHPVPTSLGHPNAVVDLAFGGPSVAAGAVPVFSAADLACSDVYCHGSKLRGPKPGGTVQRSPVWTRVDGTFQACGASCHTNPPGGDHPTHPDCRICHQAVITSFDPGTNAATWADRAKHVNGIVEHNKYHNLPGWTSPRGNPDHHGSTYFLTRQQQDEHGAACTQCHGADLQGGSVAVSCNNLTCHGGQDWRSCTFCHGTPPGQANPPTGVGGETTTGTLAVGRHAAHLTASSTHAAFTCQTCHAVPPAGDVSHALGYVPTSGLGTAGHHGDVTFAGPAAGMTFNVNATQGAPVTARGSCAGACHSNGRGGAPLVTAYWAGGTWIAGSCSSCHAASPTTGEHGAHRGELGCTGCHPAASSSSHLNGQRDVNAVIAGPQGGSVSVTPPGGPCGTRVTCTGTCHGEGHTNRCW